jgi:hypothetical protein
MMNDAEQEGMSPRAYRLLLTLPGLGFLSGMLLFAVPLALLGTPVFAPLAIVMCIASWIAMAIVSILVKCPDCGKSPFERVIPWRSRPLFFPKIWGAPWPERRCSRCGLEVGAAPD